MKQKINRLFIILFFIPQCLFSQDAKDCFKIKHLDFFDTRGLDSGWSEGKLDTLLKTSFKSDEKISNKTNFLIPIIVKQLKKYHPACKLDNDYSIFKKLVQLYFTFREKDISLLKDKKIEEQLNWMRQDFYSQVLNDSLLPYMIYTFDDGPFYGEKVGYKKNFEKGEKYTFKFGSLIITKSNSKTVFSAFNLKGRHLWSRIMTGLNKQYLNDISFAKGDYIESSLGIKLQMFSMGESLKVLLSNDGMLKFYFHSW